MRMWNDLASPAPLHVVYLQFGLVTSPVAVAIRPQLPIEVDMILGNDLAGGEVFPVPIVVDNPLYSMITRVIYHPSCRQCFLHVL